MHADKVTRLGRNKIRVIIQYAVLSVSDNFIGVDFSLSIFQFPKLAFLEQPETEWHVWNFEIHYTCWKAQQVAAASSRHVYIYLFIFSWNWILELIMIIMCDLGFHRV